MPAGSFPRRLKYLFDQLSRVCEKHKPHCASVEKVFFAHNVRSALQLGQARGVILLSLMNYNCEIFEYSPLEVKSAVTGYGRADKSQLKRMVEMIVSADFPNSKFDLTDALGLAITHAHVSGFHNKLQKQS